MENPIIEIKQELIEWVENIDDLETIQAILDLKNSQEPSCVVSDIQSEYAVKDDFEERFAKGLTLEESKKRTFDFIENLPWKK
jgi:hypothetical protein